MKVMLKKIREMIRVKWTTITYYFMKV